MQNYSPELKNRLAKYYNWMVKNELSFESDELEASVRICCFAWEGLGFSDTFVKKFVEKFDEVKQIANDMPTYQIDYTATHFDETGLPVSRGYTITLRRYKDSEFIGWVNSYLPKSGTITKITELPK